MHPRKINSISPSIGAAAVLLFSIWMVSRPLPLEDYPAAYDHIEQLVVSLSTKVSWRMRQEKLAETPEAEAFVKNLLNFNSGKCVSFINGDARITLYVAAWAPGKAKMRDVLSHTPDVCWTSAGWTLQSRGDEMFSVENTREFPVLYGTYVMRRDRLTEYIALWYNLNGEYLHGSNENAPPVSIFLADVMNWKRVRPDMQHIIRISSNFPLSSIKIREIINIVIAEISAGLGLVH